MTTTEQDLIAIQADNVLTPLEIELIDANEKLKQEIKDLEFKITRYKELRANIKRPLLAILDALDLEPRVRTVGQIRAASNAKTRDYDRPTRVIARYAKGEKPIAIAKAESISTAWVYSILQQHKRKSNAR